MDLQRKFSLVLLNLIFAVFQLVCSHVILTTSEIQMEGRKKRAAMAETEESPYGTSLDAVAGGGYKEMRWTLSVGGWSTDSTFFKALVQSKEMDRQL